MALTWLAWPTVDALRAALRTVAPDLADGPIVVRGLEPAAEPEWSGASAELDGRFVVKFAWDRPPAVRICHQARVLDALRVAAPGLPLPTVVAVSRDPALLITRREDAAPFLDVRHLITPGGAWSGPGSPSSSRLSSRRQIAPDAGHDEDGV